MSEKKCEHFWVPYKAVQYVFMEPTTMANLLGIPVGSAAVGVTSQYFVVAVLKCVKCGEERKWEEKK